MTDSRRALERALNSQQSGDYDTAEKELRELLREDPENCDGLHLMGLCFHARGENEEALFWLELAVKAQPSEPMFQTNTGLVAMELGQFDLAFQKFEAAIALDPLSEEAYNNFALLHERLRNLVEANALLEKAIALNPKSARAYTNQGNVLRGLGRIEEAINSYEKAIEIWPDLAPAYNGLGNALRQLDRRADAVAAFDKAVACDTEYAEAYFNRAMAHAAQGETELAATGLDKAFELKQDIRFLIAKAGLLPVIPKSSAEINDWRQRLADAFVNLPMEDFALAGDPSQVPAMAFYLAYHGENDRELMEVLARFYRRAYPDLTWCAPHCENGRSTAGRVVRVGVVSRYFGEHAVTWMIYGLLQGLPRERFSVSAVTFEGEGHDVSYRIKDAADEVVIVPRDIFQAREAIAAREFDILLYADIGMEPLSYYLAFARLAPVQCVTWGHPDTTGLDTLDYYISNNLAEPDNAQESYTEKLVRLDGVQSWYPRMAIPDELPDRQSLGLPEEGPLYLCPQNSIKIHPEMDAALAEILHRDPTGYLTVFESADPNWTRLLLARWEPVFGTAMNRVRVLSQRSLDSFLGVLAVADVVLDTWPFGAGNTNYQTFAMGVPVVTLPGRWIRGRGTLAHYRHMEIEGCIAATPSEYTDIAVRLATDRDFRTKIVDLIKERSDAVLEDEVSMRAFAAFLEEIAP